MLCSANLHHRAKFRTSRSSRSGDMAVYWFFKMAAVRHLRFLKVRNFNCPYPSESQCASTSQISCRSVEPLPRYGRFSIFKMAAVRHLRLSKLANFNCFIPLRGLKCVILPNFMQNGQTVAEIWPFFDFQDGGHPPRSIRHLGFFKFQNFNHPFPSEVQNASFCLILCKSVKALRRYGRFRFFKMAAVRHLRLSKLANCNCLTPLGGPKCVIFAKFCADRSNRCRDMAVFDFSRWRPSAILDLL